jgi:hypothetical protein
MQYSVHGDLLAVGTSEGVALYETQTYSLVQVVERDDTVSVLQWLQVPNGSLLLGVGGLNGVATLYSIDIDLLELQGAAVLQEFRLAYQIRAMIRFFGRWETRVELSRYVAFRRKILNLSRK